jgi:hypothetical protein
MTGEASTLDLDPRSLQRFRTSRRVNAGAAMAGRGVVGFTGGWTAREVATLFLTGAVQATPAQPE